MKKCDCKTRILVFRRERVKAYLIHDLKFNTTFIQAKLVHRDPQSIEFSIKIFPNLTNYEIQITTEKQLYRATGLPGYRAIQTIYKFPLQIM